MELSLNRYAGYPDFSCRSHRGSHHTFAHEQSGLEPAFSREVRGTIQGDS
jgi:hypothetical protein